jgi:excisionase family DNA binding protein
VRRRTPSSAGIPRLAFSIAEAAAALGLGEHSIRVLIDAGTLETLRVGNRVIIPAWSLEQFVKAGAASVAART